MSSDFMTVEVAAKVLQLHPKTVLRFTKDACGPPRWASSIGF